MSKVIIFEKPDGSGEVSIVTPVPWARLVSGYSRDGVFVKIDPPRRLEDVFSRVRSLDMYNKFLDWLEDMQVTIDWESDQQLCERIAEERTQRIETDQEMAARLAAGAVEKAAGRLTQRQERDVLYPFRKNMGLVRKVIPEGVTSYFIVDRETLPTDRSIRNAWQLNAGRVVVNETKAAAIRAAAQARSQRP